MSIRRVLLVACGVVLLLATQLWIFVPSFPRSLLGWGVLVVLGLPVSLLIEWIGEESLSARFWARRSAGTRILLGVPAVILLMGVSLALVWAVRWLVACV